MSKPPLALEEMPVDGLSIASNDRDLLEDLLIYLDYMRTRSVKRMTRTNQIPQADLNRLDKALGSPRFDNAVYASQRLSWIDFIDHLAWLAGLAGYDVKGTYRGYSSSEPSFTENYIAVSEKVLHAFLELTPAEQEKRLLEILINEVNTGGAYPSPRNEFYTPAILGRLDHFAVRGSAVGVMPSIDFVRVRRFLLEVLQQCQPGVWYSTAALIAHLKQQHPFFLIPEKIKADRWGNKSKRYDNFYEGRTDWDLNREPIAESDPDAFERVEGRYVERFLEYIPLVLRFVDVAYAPARYEGARPERGVLKAFRVQERFLRLMRGETMQPNVTVQPNFDVIVEAEIYPTKVMQQLRPLTETISQPGGVVGASVTILRLKKDLVAAELVRQPDLAVIALLRQMSGRDLPPNVLAELEEWSGHADQFTLYENIGLFEGDLTLPGVSDHIAERIAPGLALVRHAEQLAAGLESAGCVPLIAAHLSASFLPLPEAAQSLFPKEIPPAPAQPVGPQVLPLKRQTSITITFPSAEAFDAFRLALAELRCPFQPDTTLRTITLSQVHWPRFEQAIAQFADAYTPEIMDMNA
jgi:hypothetical protein